MRTVRLYFSGHLDLFSKLSLRLHRWARDRTFSFVPPDGKFILAEYRYTPNPPNSSTPRPSAPPVAKDNVPVPFVVKVNFDLEDYSGN